jgi:hypothetical protein
MEGSSSDLFMVLSWILRRETKANHKNLSQIIRDLSNTKQECWSPGRNLRCKFLWKWPLGRPRKLEDNISNEH